MNADGRQALTAGGLLAAAALAGTLVLSTANSHTAPYIAENEYQRLLDQLKAVLPAAGYDNDPVSDTTVVRDAELLGTPEPVTLYRARRQGKPTAVAFRVTAPDGYGGPIRLLVGVTAAGTVAGVRVLSHRETPGLGDVIEAGRSDWMGSFQGRSRGDPADERWKVKRDGGVFDQFTGATVTPRAVVGAVHRALVFFERHRAVLLEAAPAKTAKGDRP